MRSSSVTPKPVTNAAFLRHRSNALVGSGGGSWEDEVSFGI
jgi:hypothetical protein